MALAQITQKLAADRAKQEAIDAKKIQDKLDELTQEVKNQTQGTTGWTDAKNALDKYVFEQEGQTKHAAQTLGISIQALKGRQEQNKKITDMKDALKILADEITAAGGDPEKNEEYKNKREKNKKPRYLAGL